MQIKFYHSQTCPQCVMVERLLKQHGIEYAPCSDKQQMRSEGVDHTPTIDVDGTRLSGRAIIDWIKGYVNTNG